MADKKKEEVAVPRVAGVTRLQKWPKDVQPEKDRKSEKSDKA